MSLVAQVAMSSPRLALLIAAAAVAMLAPLATAFTPGPWYTGRATRYGSPGEGSAYSAPASCFPPEPSPQFKSKFDFATGDAVGRPVPAAACHPLQSCEQDPTLGQ